MKILKYLCELIKEVSDALIINQKMFTKLDFMFAKGMYAKEIYQAAKQGGTEPVANPSLKRLIERAKKEQVPSDIIKRAIDKVNSGVDESYTSVSYELFGPSGSTIIAECLTDNLNRSVSNIRTALNKCHLKMGAIGSVSYMYDHLCIVGFKGLSEEDAINALI